MMQIGELSRRTGLGRHQLRYYETQGLISPDRSANGYRRYSTESVVTVIQIRRLLDAGLSTDEIAYLQPCLSGSTPDLEPCAPLMEVLRSRLTDLERRIDVLESSRNSLRKFIHDTETAAGVASSECSRRRTTKCTPG